MSISALSSGFVSFHASSGAAPPAAIRREAPPAPVEAHRHAEHRPGGRQHRLEQAMMSALRALGFGGPTAAASTPPAPTAVASAQVAEPNGVINSTTAATAVQAGSPAKADAMGDVEAAKAPPDSVESAVRGVAHALFQALRQAGDSADNADRRADGVHV